MNKKILQLALPAIVTNITVPLLGLVDVAIVGHLGSASYIGAIAVGGMLFNIIYWLFGFLRMGTSGLTSQALGEKNMEEVVRILFRAVWVGGIIACILLLSQFFIGKVAFFFLQTSEEVERLALLYFRICIWGAPAVLGMYAFSGWFIGMQNARYPMIIAITQNIVNIIASLCFVFLLDMNVAGVALGTLIAQYSGLILAVLLWNRSYGKLKISVKRKEVFKEEDMRSFFRLNTDIFLRTLCLVAVTTFFTSTGAKQGDVVLAVNTLLMQLFTLFSYFMDGFAYAGEALTGLYVGARDKYSLRRMVRLLFGWGAGLALFFTLLYIIGGKGFLFLLTNDAAVINSSADYVYWVLAIPVAGFAAFLWDGIFIGATRSRLMLYAMLAASGSFFLIYYSLYTTMGNHALWLAFLVYLSLRGLVQTFLGKDFIRYNG